MQSETPFEYILIINCKNMEPSWKYLLILNTLKVKMFAGTYFRGTNFREN